MATLQERNGSFRILFVYQGKRRAFTLGKVSKAEADAKNSQVDYLLMRLKQQLVTLPPEVDIVAFLKTDGKATETPPPPTTPGMTFGCLRDRYLETHRNGTLEQSTLGGIQTDFKLLTQTLGDRFSIAKLSLADLQKHVDRRSKAKGFKGRMLSANTIKAEIITLRTAWNWAVKMKLVSGPFPNQGLRYPKTDEKPPFRTYEEIERRIASGSLSVGEQELLWNCLFLTPPEIQQLLEHVHAAALHPWIFPAFAFAAHTGTRRSEVFRTTIHDIDLAAETVLIHEKKRKPGQRTTRRVPLSPYLLGVLRDWLAIHPGGEVLFCHGLHVERSKTTRIAPTAITNDEAHDHFKRALSDSKWNVLRGWHVLRHSFISCCVASGVDQRLIDEWVGHTTEEMRRRYRHLMPSTEKTAIRSVFGG